MNNITYGLIITFLAGLSTVVGFLSIYIRGNRNYIIGFSLSFASGVMIYISLFDLLREALNYLNDMYIIYRILYMILFVVLGMFITSLFDRSIYRENSLTKIGLLSLFVVILHNIPEGILTFMVTSIDINIGMNLALGIALHNIPEGISIAIPLYYSGKSKLFIFIVLLVVGCSELFGGLIAYIVFKSFINNQLVGQLFSLIAGIMLNISFFSLLKESYMYNRKYCVIGFIMGFIVMFLSNII